MTPNDFIRAIEKSVHNSAVSSTVETLAQADHTSSLYKLTELSKWYDALSERDKEMVLAVIRQAVHSSVFGFLCVLDGVRAISNGDFELTFVDKNQQRYPLNDYAGAEGAFLHDIYQAGVWDEVFK